jgi:inhibitor of cysteine peptidase
MMIRKIGLLIGLLIVVLVMVGCAAGTGQEEDPYPGDGATDMPADSEPALSPAETPAGAYPAPTPVELPTDPVGYPTEPDLDAPIEPGDSSAYPVDPAGAGGSDLPFGGDVIERDAIVDKVEIALLESFPVQVMVTVRGSVPDGCTTIGRHEQTVEGNTIKVHLYTVRPADAMCTQALVDYEERIPLDAVGLPAGEYTVDVNGATGSFNLQIDNILPYPAGE